MTGETAVMIVDLVKQALKEFDWEHYNLLDVHTGLNIYPGEQDWLEPLAVEIEHKINQAMSWSMTENTVEIPFTGQPGGCA